MKSFFKRAIETVADRDTRVYFTPTAESNTKTLALYEEIVYCDSSGNAGTVYLPFVSEAEGMRFTVILKTAGNNLTVADQDDSEDWSDVTLDEANDKLTVVARNGRWVTVELDEQS